MLPHATRCPGGIRFSSPFDPARTPLLVDDFKRLAPAHLRRYDPETREWFVAFAYAEQALRVFLRHFPEADVYDKDTRDQAPPSRPRQPLATERHYAALHLLPSASPAIVNAVYKTLVKQHHPDHLPALERDHAHLVMVEINGAYEALRAHGAA